jgi:hypothetical protein
MNPFLLYQIRVADVQYSPIMCAVMFTYLCYNLCDWNLHLDCTKLGARPLKIRSGGYVLVDQRHRIREVEHLCLCLPPYGSSTVDYLCYKGSVG